MSAIILLNGTSSSGKSSIAIKMQELSNSPFMHVPLDAFLRMVRPVYFHDMAQINTIVRGFHQSLNALASAGNPLIIDHVIQEGHWLTECITALAGHTVHVVGVKCDLEILKQRELNRGNRAEGTAEYQYNLIHEKLLYDFEVDTGTMAPEECASAILRYVDQNPEPGAWEALKGKFM